MKIKEKNKAIEMRKLGFSMGEISRELNVSKSTVSLWVSDVSLSEIAQKRLDLKISHGQKEVIKMKKIKTQLKDEEARTFASKEIKNIDFKIENQRLLCAMIYWCEGSKSKSDSVRFTNSDPNLLKTFLQLFRKSFNLDESKFRVCVHLHKYHNVDKQLNFWSKTLRIQLRQFVKPYLKKSSGLYKKDGYQGCVSLRYYDVSIARKLTALAQVFMSKGD